MVVSNWFGDVDAPLQAMYRWTVMGVEASAAAHQAEARRVSANKALNQHHGLCDVLPAFERLLCLAAGAAATGATECVTRLLWLFAPAMAPTTVAPAT